MAKKKPAVNNDVEKPNENNTTPTNKPDSGNNTASANNSNYLVLVAQAQQPQAFQQ